MIQIYVSTKHPEILIYKYSKKICIEDIQEADVFFKDYIKTRSFKYDIIADIKKVNGFSDKDFILEAAKKSRENERIVNSVCIFGLKKIFYYIFKVYLSITSAYMFEQVLVNSAEDAEKKYSVSISQDFTCVFEYEKETSPIA